jgi:AbrB family looped-hinge helix DNA binding protein
MFAKLSSKGQLVIPRQVRRALGLVPGMRLSVRVEDGRIVLEPVRSGIADSLYGCYRDADLLGTLEAEHRAELAADGREVRP